MDVKGILRFLKIKSVFYVVVSVLASLVIILIVWIVRMVLISSMQNKIEDRVEILRELKAESSKGLNFKEKLVIIRNFERKAGEDFSLLTYIESKARALNIRDRLTKIDPKEINVDANIKKIQVSIALESITIQEAISFLTSLEDPGRFIYVKRIKIIPKYADPYHYNIYSDIVYIKKRRK